MTKPHHNLFIVGLFLILGSALAVDFMPENAGLYDWSYLLSFTFAGLIAMGISINDRVNEECSND